MADVAPVEYRTGSTAQYKASWLERPVRHVWRSVMSSSTIYPLQVMPSNSPQAKAVMFISSAGRRDRLVIATQLPHIFTSALLDLFVMSSDGFARQKSWSGSTIVTMTIEPALSTDRGLAANDCGRAIQG